MILSIIIPCYNEEKRIKTTISRILSYLDRFNYEIIIIDDASTDNTVNIVKKFNNKHIRIIKKDKNKGKGYSVKAGILSAKGDYILFTDADLSTPIEEIDRFLQSIKKYDIVIASRNLPGSKVKKQPLLRRTLGKTFPLLVDLLAIKGIKDTQCGFKMFKKDIKKIFEKQRLDGFCFDVEILYIAKKHNYSIKELPVVWINSPASKVHPVKDSFKMFFDLIKIRLNNLKGYYD